ncbi:MAG TPA: hypothetical protein VGN95_22140 [Pyrinomonadaceae bacterium]|nr:hypothetical protein [Pyrinomonadaceae bacterium]
MKDFPVSPIPVWPEIETAHAVEFIEQLRRVTDSLPSHIDADAQNRSSEGLAKPVLVLVEPIRRSLEKQAIR